MGTMAIRAQIHAQSTSVAAGIACLGLVAGCSGSAGDTKVQQAPARLDLAAAAPAAIPGGVEAAGMQLEVFRCDEEEPVFRRKVGFSAGKLDELEAFADKPIRLAKDHLFSRSGVSLDAGCYQVSATPLDLHDRPIDECTPAESGRMPLGPSSQRRLLLAARCGQAPSDTPVVDGELNFAPVLTDLTSRFDASSDTFEVCAHTFEPDADPIEVEWKARAENGHAFSPIEVRSPVPSQKGQSRKNQPRKNRRTCATFERFDAPVEVTATVLDGVRHPWRGFLSREAYRLHLFGIATPSRAEASVRVSPSEQIPCARAAVDDWTYWIRRDGKLLPPTERLTSVRPGDTVEVELDVADGCKKLEAELVAFHGSVKSHDSLSRIAERDTGTFGPGTHVLWVDVPERPFSIALAAKTSDGYQILDQVDPTRSLVDVAH